MRVKLSENGVYIAVIRRKIFFSLMISAIFHPSFTTTCSRTDMRFFKQLFTTIGFGFIALTAAIAPASAGNSKQNGYTTLAVPQNTDAGNKVEVLEFFWYSCPHCYALDPSLSEWVKKQGSNIVFKRVPVIFTEKFVPQQKLYYALETMGKAEEMHSKIFNAIHVSRQHLDTDATILDFVVKNGIDKKKFTDTYGSISVQSKVQRVGPMQTAFKIDGVPHVVVDGRFTTSLAMVAETMPPNAGEPALFVEFAKVLDGLVLKAKKH